MLNVAGLSKSFGGIAALKDVTFAVAKNEIVGLIGPNGAGKTTVFNCLNRIYQPDAGQITFNDIDLLALRASQISPSGVARTFQNSALFDALPVLENIKVGMAHSLYPPFVSQVFATKRARQADKLAEEEAVELACFVGLKEYQNAIVGELPFPLRKKVELARALACKPRLLLLDEPAAGLNHDEIQTLRASILQIREDRGASVLLVEHHMNLVMSTCDRIVVLNFGQRIAEGAPSTVQNDRNVLEAYLGSTKTP